LPGSGNEAGEQGWLLYDPLRHQYFSLGRTGVVLLDLFRKTGSLAALKAQIRQAKLDIDDYDIEKFIAFTRENFLVAGQDAGHVHQLAENRQRRQTHWFMWLVHNYLFIKIPLIRPDRALARLLPILGLLAGRGFRLLVYALGVYGLFNLFYQWEAFGSAFSYFFNMQGMVYYLLALVGVKMAHELGHALVAKYHGLRVSSMGVALLVLFPVLYTDNTDAWRLVDARKKLQIVLAGILVELHIALLALFAWGVMDDGPLRSVAYFLTTASIVGSLLVNLNPFMRFDGYYALADYLGMQNLQPRAFALARWQMRQWLFGLPEPVPEPFDRQRHYFLVFYSFATWAYRFFLFIGIALLVYFFAFKLLGLFLFIVEIGWFILRPIVNEMRQWWQRRALFSMNRNTIRTLLLLGGLVCLIALPWRSGFSVPAVLEAERQMQLFLPEAALVETVHVSDGAQVKPGDILLTARSAALTHDIETEQRKIRLLQAYVRRHAASRENLRDKLVREEELAAGESRLRGLLERRERLSVRATIGGRVSLSNELQAGRWHRSDEQLIFIYSDNARRITAYIEEGRLEKLSPEADGVFLADNVLHPAMPARLQVLDETAVTNLAHRAMASPHGGPIATREEPEAPEIWRPETAIYKTVFMPTAHVETGEDTIGHDILGELHIRTAPYSPLSQLWKQISALFIRESGF